MGPEGQKGEPGFIGDHGIPGGSGQKGEKGLPGAPGIRVSTSHVMRVCDNFVKLLYYVKVICCSFDFRVETVSLDLLDLLDERVIVVSMGWKDCLDVLVKKENPVGMEAWEFQDCEDRLVHRE